MAIPNRYGIQIRTIRAGRDYVLLVTGGEAHVGASAVAYWDGVEVRCGLTEVPGHKEGELAAELAEQACRRLRATVSVIAGIHIDFATRQEIGEMVEVVRILASQELDALDHQRIDE